MIRLPFLLALVALSLGCSSRNTDDPLPPPWPEAEAPQRLRDLALDLQTYLAETGRMPATLTRMDELHLSAGGPYAPKAYAYHGAGIALLRDGWRLVAVDDRRVEPGRVWCVVRPPVRTANAPRFRVVLISLAELRESGG